MVWVEKSTHSMCILHKIGGDRRMAKTSAEQELELADELYVITGRYFKALKITLEKEAKRMALKYGGVEEDAKGVYTEMVDNLMADYFGLTKYFDPKRTTLRRIGN
jgi:hypothetical protein